MWGSIPNCTPRYVRNITYRMFLNRKQWQKFNFLLLVWSVKHLNLVSFCWKLNWFQCLCFSLFKLPYPYAFLYPCYVNSLKYFEMQINHSFRAIFVIFFSDLVRIIKIHHYSLSLNYQKHVMTFTILLENVSKFTSKSNWRSDRCYFTENLKLLPIRNLEKLRNWQIFMLYNETRVSSVSSW